jgi:phosphoglucosamine mutase
MRADLGVMISASHNPYEDNGIKLFGPDGFKLSDEDELAIEAMLDEDRPLAPAEDSAAPAGSTTRAAAISTRSRPSLPDNVGSTACDRGRLRQRRRLQVAPSALWELGAEVIAIGVEPNGKNINDNCGSTHLDLMLRETVVARRRHRHRAGWRCRPADRGR